MNHTIDELTAQHPAELEFATDGRVLRRNRNMESVRKAVVELLAEGVDLSIQTVAERAGVAGRSVYRYYGDLEGAVRDAVISRLDEVTRRIPKTATIDSTSPLDVRIQRVCRDRVEMWWSLSPVIAHLPDTVREAAMRRFDEAVLATFAGELTQFASSERKNAESTLAVMVRMRSIDSLAGLCEYDIPRTTAALEFAMRRFLTSAL